MAGIIPWISRNLDNRQRFVHAFESDKSPIEHHPYSLKALDLLKGHKVPVILTDIDVPPGDFSDNPELAELLPSLNFLQQRYTASEYILQQLRSPHSINIDTPIVITDAGIGIVPEIDDIVSRSRCLRRIAAINLAECQSSEEFVRKTVGLTYTSPEDQVFTY